MLFFGRQWQRTCQGLTRRALLQAGVSTVLGLSLDNELVGLFGLRDTLKTGAKQVVAELHAMNLETYLVTGDNPLTARRIAEETGIAAANVFAEVRPEKKSEFVRQLQAKGRRVAFVGDGINDAPALEQADLGIAVCRASDIAREAVGVIERSLAGRDRARQRRVGPAMAARIIEYRTANGPFRSIDDLDNVKGIGPRTLDKLRPMVTTE